MKPYLIAGAGAPAPLGASADAVAAAGAGDDTGGVNFAVYSRSAVAIFVCLFDQTGGEIARFELPERQGDIHFGLVGGLGVGDRYGFRAQGVFAPEQGLYFNPDRLLVDPYARRIDRPFVHDERLLAGSESGVDTASLMPKGVICAPHEATSDPLRLKPGGLIYELNVRGFTHLHPGVPRSKRGTVAALAEESVVSHFLDLGVDALELMPLGAFIEERHLPPLGLSNAWGYNPVTYFAPDQRLMPGGICELRAVSDIYRAHNIPVILDVVYNHTGESDLGGTILSLKGLDAKAYYRHTAQAGGCRLVNDTGCGNTLRCDFPAVQDMVLESLKFWAEAGGVSGFRFDLAPVLGRGDSGFSARAELLQKLHNDEVLSKCILIAEPWDPGPGGYHLGKFGKNFSEWNDRYRDDIRGFWRSEPYKLGVLATRLAGSRDVFGQSGDLPSRGVNFLSAHDGFTLQDLVSYSKKHNLGNGENNRDGHGHNLSWNNGVEGETADLEIIGARKNDVRALLATLFFSRGLILLGQGDEMGRSQGGNNNAYAQNNATSWVTWEQADRELILFVGALQRLRRKHLAISADQFLSGRQASGDFDVLWLNAGGKEMKEADWNKADGSVLGMQLNIGGDEVLIWFNRSQHGIQAKNPSGIKGQGWKIALCSNSQEAVLLEQQIMLPPRSVVFLEQADDRQNRKTQPDAQA